MIVCPSFPVFRNGRIESVLAGGIKKNNSTQVVLYLKMATFRGLHYSSLGKSSSVRAWACSV